LLCRDNAHRRVAIAPLERPYTLFGKTALDQQLLQQCAAGALHGDPV